MMKYRCLSVLALAGLLAWPLSGQAGTFDKRVSALPARVAVPYEPDGCMFETALDRRPYQALNLIQGPHILDNPDGWSVEARTGGRPFICFHDLRVNGTRIDVKAGDFKVGQSGIPVQELESHFSQGKTVNRLWFTHRAGNGYPVVLVLTPDGFANPAGSAPPFLQGAAVRLGFIRNPFAPGEARQHCDELSITAKDDQTLLLLLNVHGEPGEGVLAIELAWDEVLRQPVVHCQSALRPRLEGRFGVAGFDFLRGPTLFGLTGGAGAPPGGIQAYHDGRTLSLQAPQALPSTFLLVPPVSPDRLYRDVLAGDLRPGTRLAVDQPQNQTGYFSKHPEIPYEHRTDLVLDVQSTSTAGLWLERAQCAVDPAAANPEANETVNLFLSLPLNPAETTFSAFTLRLAAEDFELRQAERRRGVVFVSTWLWPAGSLFFQPLDERCLPSGPVIPLTDGLIENPRHPVASSDGRFLFFDAAEDVAGRPLSRIYALDLCRGTQQRLSLDPFGTSADRSPAISADSRTLAFISNRSGENRLLVAPAATGQGPGMGDSLTSAGDVDAHPLLAEWLFCQDEAIRRRDHATGQTSLLVTAGHPRAPRYSPGGDRVAFADDGGLYLIGRDGSNLRQVAAGGDHPAWADSNHLIFERPAGGAPGLWLLDLATLEERPLILPEGMPAGQPEYVCMVLNGGDLNDDGRRDGEDRFLLAEILAGNRLSPVLPVAPDVNANGRCNIQDLLLLKLGRCRQ